MNIREWFGFSGDFNSITMVNESIEKLLYVYSNALKEYFSVHDAKDYKVIKTLNEVDLNIEQKLFLEWLNNKGFDYLCYLASTNFANDATLNAKIQYDLYILEEEMDFEFPNDVMSSLISVVNDFPDYLAATKHPTENTFDYFYNPYNVGKNPHSDHYYYLDEIVANHITATTVEDIYFKDTQFSKVFCKPAFSGKYNPKLEKLRIEYIIEEVDNTKAVNEPEIKSGSFLIYK